MNLKKAIVVLLIIEALLGAFFEILYFHIPSWIEYGDFDIFQIANTSTRLLHWLSHIFTLIGAVQLIKMKKLELIGIFKFPIYLFMAGNVFWFITANLSTTTSFFLPHESSPWFVYLLKALNILLLLLIIVYYSKNSNKPAGVNIRVSHGARLLNWLIDLWVIFSFAFANIRLLMDGFLLENIEFFNETPYWFFTINIFFYFFVLELLFGQTVGKTRNHAYVIYKDGKVMSLFIRTLCRFIPFEAFSFLGTKGWHDSMSHTTVVKIKDQEAQETVPETEESLN